jgi:HD-GYP domain-containing protein (c-di-GMP phosphodiesterase class II)
MRNAEDQIIGVLQLINKKVRPEVILYPAELTEREVIPFAQSDEQLGLALAGQAAVALENSLLYEDRERLFEGFIRASVQAIESRDPTTSGHSERVALLTVSLAEAASAVTSGPLRDMTFSQDQLREIRYAGLLHDFGKVGVNENVLVKAKKLYPRDWENLVLRFALAKTTMLFSDYRRRVEILREEGAKSYVSRVKELDEALERDLKEIDNMLDTLDQANTPQVLSEEVSRALQDIANRSYEDIDGRVHPLLTPYEVVNLSIPRGTLNQEERREIESHVAHSFQFLQAIPWTRSLRGVPTIAYAHHERLDGSGYPCGLKGTEIMPQSRMMAIADIFDALTAADRPYKRAVPVQQALKILEEEAERGQLDLDLVRLFIEKRVYEKVLPPKT